MINKRNDVYFATLTDSTFIDELKSRVSDYRRTYQSNGLAQRWSLSLGSYYGASPDGKLSWKVTNGGEMGELVQHKVNEYGSLVKHELVLAVKDRPAGVAKAVNSDPATLRNARVGTQLVEYYLSDPSHNFEGDYVNALLLALLTAESYVVQDWDTTAGETIAQDPETGEEINSGDITQGVFPVWDAARDAGSPNGKVNWYIFSRFVNKFELAAKFPAYSEEIVAQSSINVVTAPFLSKPGSNSDYIEEFLFIHFPSKALPQGRYARFTNDVVFMDVPYPYASKNVHRVTDQEMVGTSFGHTGNYDLLGLEQVTDGLHSIILNNESTFGIPTVVGPKGAGIMHTDLAKGLRYLELDPQHVDKIKTLDLVRTAPEIFNYVQMLSQKKGTMSGINSVIQGDPSGALKGASGSAMALLQSQAIVYNSGVQLAFYRLLSSAGTGIIELCRRYSMEPRIVRIAGKANASAVKEFKYSADTLNAVSTVIFEPVNPVLQTAAGRLTVAQDLLKMPGMITSPKRYLEVLTTGNLDVFLDDDVALQDAILEENEFLTDGKPVKAVATENHSDHIKGHQSVIAMPSAKADPELVQRTLAHIQEHIDLWKMLSEQNPSLLAATNQQVLPNSPAPQPQQAPQGNPNPASVMNQQGPGPQPMLPKPPTNPATNQNAPVAPGTAVRHQ